VDLFRAIIEGELVWKKPQFDSVSAEAKDLIQKLITKDVDARFDAEQALKHPFIVTNTNDKQLCINEIYGGLQQLSVQITAQRKAKWES